MLRGRDTPPRTTSEAPSERTHAQASQSLGMVELSVAAGPDYCAVAVLANRRGGMAWVRQLGRWVAGEPAVAGLPGPPVVPRELE